MEKLTSTEELIMTAILNQDLYGLQIVKAIEEVSNGKKKMQVGFLYPKLHSLEKKGYVESYWGDKRPEERQGARRKYYKLTGLGKSVLKEKQQLLNDLKGWQPTTI